MTPSMSAARQAGVGEGALGRLRGDLVRGAARRLAVVGVADADDRDLAADVVELAGESPVVRHCRMSG